MNKLILATLLVLTGFFSIVPHTYANDDECQCGVDEDGECLPCN